ncbi:unnamed protein product [Rotaria sp. Silwood1]|nr:unnamed protein product [Rotaria sp. Silwood1]CAF1644391.1 unnamed protein product [Rotaria sp. Silwood1]CAF3811669.1 unnamed protein product [Rotaria sp. Silwood1]CAF4710245.1 unnamed protein product [Rotaria sp. Silwood1]
MSILLKQKSSSYVRGFKVPRKLDIDNALGKLDDNTIKSIFTEEFCETFDSLPLPKKESDWLAQNAEKGQTYMEFLQLSRTLHTKSSSHRRTIYLTVFGQIDNTIFDIDSLIDYTQRFFQMQVKLINPFIDVQWNDKNNQWTCTMTLNNGKSRSFNLRTRYNEKTKHSQICVTGILNLLKKIVPEDARCLIALTMFDLYGDDTDLFIAGLAMGNCRVAAFSLYRYDPYLTFNESDWFDCKLKIATKSKNQIVKRRNLLLLRTCRLLTHEICHLFGIPHCIFYSCLVNGSGDLDEDFGQPLLECPIDLRKLYSLINFNIHTRYEQLLEFFKMHNFLDEMKMVETKLNVIKHLMKSDSSEFNSSGNLSNSFTSTKIAKRKRTHNITTKQDVLTATVAVAEDEEQSQTPAKHLKRQ